MKDTNKKSIPNYGNMCQEELKLYKDFSKGFPKMNVSTPFIPSKGWLQRFSNRFGLTTIIISGKAAFANEEPAATFSAESKKLITFSKSSTVTKPSSSRKRCQIELKGQINADTMWQHCREYDKASHTRYRVKKR